MLAVNLKQIAEAAGVSVATASRVLSGSDYPVNEALRQRVLDTAEALDYVPNAKARGLLQGNSQTIGVLAGDVSDPYFSAIIGGIHAAAAEAGYLVTIMNTYRDPDAELAAMRSLHAHRVDVLILSGSGLTYDAYQAGLATRLGSFVRGGGAAVLVGPHEVPEKLEVGRVLIDNVAASRKMAEHLHGLGHRKVALLAGDQHLISTIDREDGFRQVYGDELVVHPVEPNRDGGLAGTQWVLANHPEVTAIAATADQMALGALVALRQAGVAVPGEVSVTGFNDIAISRDLVPALTTVHVPLREVGEQALQAGLAMLRGEITEVSVRSELMIRESTGPVDSR